MTDIAQSIVQLVSLRNKKSGVTHYYQPYLFVGSSEEQGHTRCGILVRGNGYEVVNKRTTCKNCLHPGHGNLWRDN